MSLILLGILNSQVSGAAAGAYDLLESTVLTSSASSVSFTGLDGYSDYKHLQIRATGRTTAANTNSTAQIRFNSVSTSNNSWHEMFGQGSSVSSQAWASQTSIGLGNLHGGNSGANEFSGWVIDILDFSSGSKNTTVRYLNGKHDSAGLDLIRFGSGAYYSTDAVASLEILFGGNSAAIGSRFSLMGVK